MKISSLVLALVLAVLFVSCTKDLSRRIPYRKAIGKKFVLQQDLYVYSFNDYGKYSWPVIYSCKLQLGTTTNLPATFDSGLPRTVEEKYIGMKNSHITLVGVLQKRTILTIKRIIKENTVDNVYYSYLISPTQGPFAGQEIDPSDIINTFENPPYSKTWSDPPIFKPEYALPLDSEGIWWK